MSKSLYRKMLVVIAVSFMLIAYISIDTVWKEKNQGQTTTTNSPAIVDNNGVSSGKYLLKALDNKIAVYQQDIENPIRIVDVSITTLPEYDQQSMQIGIYVKDDEALDRILEDLDS